jgi:hypothetical protein
MAKVKAACWMSLQSPWSKNANEETTRVMTIHLAHCQPQLPSRLVAQINGRCHQTVQVCCVHLRPTHAVGGQRYRKTFRWELPQDLNSLEPSRLTKVQRQYNRVVRTQGAGSPCGKSSPKLTTPNCSNAVRRGGIKLHNMWRRLRRRP